MTRLIGRALMAPLANEPVALLDALMNGVSAIGPLTHPDVDHFRQKMGFEVDPPSRVEPLRSSRWVTRLIRCALTDAGIDRADGERLAVVLGTGQRELNSVELWAAGRAGAITADELSYRRAVTDAVGPVRTYSVLGACAAGLLALGLAIDLLDDQEADVVVVVSAEPIHATVQAMHDRVAVQLPDAVRPFDKDRRGTIIGEGAAAVVLARGDRPGSHKAPRVRAVGFSSDARESTAPDVDGLMAAMRFAHEEAELAPSAIDLVLAHGTGTKRNDEAEACALTKLGMTNAFVTSPKSAMGHTLASAGLINLIIAATCLEHRVVPPTLNLTALDPTAAGIRVPTEAQTDVPLRYAQVDAFGFGGINAVAILERGQ